jgi:hypothetical protein
MGSRATYLKFSLLFGHNTRKSTEALCILRLALIKLKWGLLLVLSKSERLSKYCFFLAAFCLTGVGSADTAQGFIDETRIGILESVDGPAGDKYGAPDINVEVLFERSVQNTRAVS